MTTDDIRLSTIYLCNVFLLRAYFPLTKLLTMIGFFVTQKGPHTHVIGYSRFVKERIKSKKAGERS